MRILIVGSNLPWAIERHFVKYLIQNGADVSLYPAGDIVFDYHSRNIFNKLLFKTKLKTSYREVSDGLVDMANEFKPDVIWIFKGMEIYPKTLAVLKKQGFKLANFNPDHPFIISSRGSGNKNVSDSVGLYNLHFCYHLKLQKEIEERFNIPAIFLPFAYEDSELVYTDPNFIKEINRVCFQGNPDQYRIKIVSLLAANGFPVDVYGIGWEKTKLAKISNVQIHDIASRPDFWRKNQEYRLQLNLFRQYNVGSHNMRTFEIPAVGGIQLTEYSDEQAKFFKEDVEIFFFRNEKDLVDKVDKILKMSDSEIRSLRNNARKRSLTSGYSFADRALTVYNAFKKLI
jgi:spore maturation protein CgeB